MGNASVTIRAAERADRAQWLPLWQGYQAFYKVDLGEAVTALTWERLHDPAEPMHCAVAEETTGGGGGRLVGLVHYIFHRSCWLAGPSCYLQDLFAAPDMRGRGIGRALIEHVYARAAEAGSTRVWWLTHETNAQAMLLYDRIAEKSGFVQYRKAIVPMG
ncbi:MAG: GNAT family N-acetyltransferase [Rubrivivax sp.]|nr:GNAT family N-acetyltransferase [Rubrivivax sp.]